MPTPIVELSLNSHGAGTRPGPDRRLGVFAAFSDRLLRLFGTAVPDSARPVNVRFAQRVEHWRNRIRTETDAGVLDTIAAEILAECEVHANRFNGDLAQREAEVGDLMCVLHEVIDALHGESRRFDLELQRSTESIRTMVGVDDIREIKRVLSLEVDNIRKAAVERQAAESKRVERLTAQVEALRNSLREARMRAMTDALTGTANRGALEQEIKDFLRRASRTGKGFSLAMVDLDHLKRINDTHGHQVGDRVLMACAKILQDTVGAAGLVARYGGEEFGVIMHTPNVDDGRRLIEAALARIPPTYQYTVDKVTKGVSFSFSAGVTAYATGDTAEAIVKRADDALYDAKRKGRKRVEVKERGLIGNLVGWVGTSGRRSGDPETPREQAHQPADRAADGSR
jgi:diguanylate cyclase (GGDEF)-like protein